MQCMCCTCYAASSGRSTWCLRCTRYAENVLFACLRCISISKLKRRPTGAIDFSWTNPSVPTAVTSMCVCGVCGVCGVLVCWLYLMCCVCNVCAVYASYVDACVVWSMWCLLLIVYVTYVMYASLWKLPLPWVPWVRLEETKIESHICKLWDVFRSPRNSCLQAACHTWIMRAIQ